jgi:hypothetical protein
MATNPDTLLPAPQDTAAQGRAALQSYLLTNKGKATLEGAKAVGAQFGLTVSDSAQAAIDWANRKDTDVSLIPITTDVLADVNEPLAVDLVSPEGPPPESARGILEAAATGAADVFAREPSLGLDPENRQALAQLGPIGRVLLTPLGDIGAGALTTLQAGLEGGTLGIGQLMENVGLLDVIESATGVQQSPESARNELMAILESEGLRAPMGYATPRPAPVAPIQQIARAPELPEAPVTPIQRIAQAPELPPAAPRATMTAPQRADALAALEQKGQTQPVMELGLSRKSANFAADYLNEAGLTRPDDVPFTQFFYDHFTAGTLPDETVQRLFKQYDMTPVDVVEAATGLRASASELGRGLGLLSQVSRLVPTAAAEIARVGARTQPDPSLWVRAGNAMRGLLVSQVATTMRNVVGTAVRAAPVGLDPFVRTVDNIVNASLNPVRKLRGEEAVPVNPLDAWVLTTQQFRPKQTDEIFRQLRNAQPKINKKLLSAYSPDVTRPILNDKFGKVEAAHAIKRVANEVFDCFDIVPCGGFDLGDGFDIRITKVLGECSQLGFFGCAEL